MPSNGRWPPPTPSSSSSSCTSPGTSRSSDCWRANDWKDRELWDEYTEAYEDAIGKCATPDAPWIVVPANAKWYRDLVVAEAVADALRPHKKEWRKTLDKEGKVRRHDLEEWRAKHRSR
jgi:hypothetical protein